MKYLCLAFLAAMSFWTVSVASEDMGTSKITNKKVLFGAKLLLAALAAQSALTAYGYFGKAEVYLYWAFYPLYLQHLLLSAFGGIILWYSEIWPAGDAKFFILVSAALPLAFPEIKNFPQVLFLRLLINIFVMASLAAVARYISSSLHVLSPGAALEAIWGDIKLRLSALTGEKTRLLDAFFLLNLLFIFLMQQVLARELKHALGGVFTRVDILYFFLFLLWDKVGVHFRTLRWQRFTLISYLLYFFAGFVFFYDHLFVMVFAAVGDLLKFSLLLFFGRFLLMFLMEKKDLRFVGWRELEPGMVLSEKSGEMLRNNSHFEGAFDDSFRDGLDEEQLALLTDWMKKLKVPDPKIEVVVGRPFGLWIALGAAVSLLLDKNLGRFFL